MYGSAGSGPRAASATELRNASAVAAYVRPDIFKGALDLTKTWDSGNLAITLNSASTATHTLGEAPKFVQTWLTCLTAELGYAVGDNYHNLQAFNEAANSRGLYVLSVSPTDIRYGFAGGIVITQKSNPAAFPAGITPANWNLRIKLWA